MLKTSKLNLFYGKSQILFDINLTAKIGEVTCVLGTNGVGKTSLMRAITGAHPISEGNIFFNGDDITHSAPYQRAKRGIAYVPQGRDIFPMLTVEENLATGFSCLPVEQHFVPDSISEMFPILNEMKDRKGGDLSGGQQQQLAIARALITQPKVLILDEPTEGIQPNIIAQIGEVIKRLKANGDIAIVLVEQYFDFAYKLADHFYTLKRGSVTLDATKTAITRDEVLANVTV
ncbi:MAG: urea ABC transporter ATP-binding subunit UrtE [Rhodobacteraceae bacterium]|nr:MAG: urea ABC transporter ATP-binding subunit UrtE [Paracoccaceae bacterium]